MKPSFEWSWVDQYLESISDLLGSKGFGGHFSDSTLCSSLSSRLGQAPFIMAAVRGGPWLLVSQMLGFLLKLGSTFTNSLLGSLHGSTSPSVMRLEPAEVASSLRDCFSWSLTQCLALAAFPKPFNAIKIKYHLGDLGYQVWLPVWGENHLGHFWNTTSVY